MARSCSLAHWLIHSKERSGVQSYVFETERIKLVGKNGRFKLADDISSPP